MTKAERNGIKEAVKEGVEEQLPETLAEHLTPMIKRTVKDVLRPFRRSIVAGYAALFVFCVFLYIANRERVEDIQEQRRILCEDQNIKHDATVAEIDRQVAKRKKGLDSKRAAILDQRRNETIILIQALAPKRDCTKTVSD